MAQQICELGLTASLAIRLIGLWPPAKKMSEMKASGLSRKTLAGWKGTNVSEQSQKA